ncbi:MAG: cobalt ABC transporter permease [Firmicutes bacterium ZCTH02-B6]|nr:MAG: cobalt ABC transporter permease [Firmicutes bacterium ZCTH02-B6]
MRVSLYVSADTWLHRLDPMTKLLMAATGVTLTFILTRTESAAVLLAIFLAALGTGRVLRQAASVFAGVGIVAATFLIVQGLVHPTNATPLIALGPVVLYTEGLLIGLRLALRLYNILSATLILVLATNPADLTEALVRRGAPARLGYVIMSVLQIIPTMVAQSAAITDAQRSRGMETEGSLWTRAKAFLPLMGPLVTSSLIATEERALALEVRGFGSTVRPTFLRAETRPPHAVPVRILCVLTLALGATGRWVLGW